jgi:hypothetical protein
VVNLSSFGAEEAEPREKKFNKDLLPGSCFCDLEGILVLLNKTKAKFYA